MADTQTQTDRNSILISTKKMLGIAADYTAFDLDIIIHINSVLSTLQQLGVGLTDSQYEVMDETDTWDQVLSTQKNLSMIKSYVYLRVRLLFDPPAAGYTTTSFANQIQELEWRIMTAASSSPNEGSSSNPDPGNGGGVTPEEIAQAVSDYISEHPVADGVLLQQVSPLSTWSFSHNLGRVPVVAIYVDGEEVEADVTATSSTVTVEFASPTAGFAVLT